jgi:hemerythrin superfamily protein
MAQSDTHPTDDPIIDPVLEDPPVGPPYGGAADEGVVSSVGEHDPEALDAVAFVQAEHRKLEAVLDEVLEQLASDGMDAVRARWGGIVRETLEHAVAEERVVWEAVPAESLASVREQQHALVQVLQDQDALNPEVDADQLHRAVALVREHTQAVEAVVVPALQQLPAARLMALGEDLRQVMG